MFNALARDEVDDRTALHAAATTPDLSSSARCPRAFPPPAARLSMPKTRRLTPARPPPERLAARARRMPGPAMRPQSAPLPRSRARRVRAARNARCNCAFQLSLPALAWRAPGARRQTRNARQSPSLSWTASHSATSRQARCFSSSPPSRTCSEYHSPVLWRVRRGPTPAAESARCGPQTGRQALGHAMAQ